MATTFEPRLWNRTTASVPPARSLGRRMRVHAATALIAFAALQLWLVLDAVNKGAASALLFIPLGILMALAIPLTRKFERRWYRRSREALASWGLHARFCRDVRRLWAVALVLPFLWVNGALAASQAIAG